MMRARGLRGTTPRIAILGYFFSQTGRKSHAEVFEAFRNRGFHRATVYRILTDLADVQLLVRADHGDHIWRFSLKSAAAGCEGHPHFVCNECGTVSCLPDTSVSLENGTCAPKALAKNQVAVHLKGVCDGCA